MVGFLADGSDFSSDAASVAVIDSGTTLFYFNDQLYQEVIS